MKEDITLKLQIYIIKNKVIFEPQLKWITNPYWKSSPYKDTVSSICLETMCKLFKKCSKNPKLPNKLMGNVKKAIY